MQDTNETNELKTIVRVHEILTKHELKRIVRVREILTKQTN